MLESLATPFIISNDFDCVTIADRYWIECPHSTLINCGTFYLQVPYDSLVRYKIIGIQPVSMN